MAKKKGMSRREARRIARASLVRCIEVHSEAVVKCYDGGAGLKDATLVDFASAASGRHFEAAARAAEALAALG